MSDTVTIRLPDDVSYDVVAYAATHSLTVPQFVAKIVAEAVRTPDDLALILVELLELNAPYTANAGGEVRRDAVTSTGLLTGDSERTKP